MKYSLHDSERKVLSFMESVEDRDHRAEADEELKNSDAYKLNVLKRERERARGMCLDALLTNVYKNAVPLNDCYKSAYDDDLCRDMGIFINNRCPEGIEYYVKEAIRRGSQPAKRLMEAANDIVDDAFRDKEMNLSKYTANDLVFKMDNDTQRRIDVVGQDLSFDDLSQVIRDNVKNSAISEITRAKKEKEDLKNFEQELVNDMSVTSESAVRESVERRNMNTKGSVFNPRLFQGILIGKTNQYQSMMESGKLEPVYTFGSLDDFRESTTMESSDSLSFEEVSVGDIAFVESVKEFTKLNVVKAFKLETFDRSRIASLANSYAQNV